ncbi:DUF2786 domain-containing protein [Streptomyces sp. ASQP_92]|uniref:DUF2786 domain-containing protein n=1 Tax=Streptomyces sp. ASQP_92 TaxID=2979116 RepID=UPI0021C15A1C|nr:DUF2786 domain-containing protein [Streptomyces sp. ASQP_92]MCT9091291.1 DUF2786 domain-containing protein [Streptomyces sp. ASQP_92]
MEAVDRAFAAALYIEGDAALDTGASLLAAAPEADVELALRGREFVRRAWDRGWQPADVVRIVRRDLDEPQVRILSGLIRDELASYERLPARWQGQVDELPGEPWRADRFSYATAVLELYRTLLALPAIEPAGPAPGASGAAGLGPPVHGEPKTLARIRALLAKAEATGFPEEAEALTTKAQELMARHSVDDALLAGRGLSPGGEVPGACRIGVDAPYETAKAILLDAVASANHCRAVWNSALGFSTVVGFEADLEAVELLYTSLLVQGTTAMAKAEAAQRAGGRRRTKTFRQSFLLAYAARLGDLLAAAARGVEESFGGELLPVLASRAVAVGGRAEEMFPRTVATRVRGVSDESGWRDGRAAADRAHRTRTPGLPL